MNKLSEKKKTWLDLKLVQKLQNSRGKFWREKHTHTDVIVKKLRDNSCKQTTWFQKQDLSDTNDKRAKIQVLVELNLLFYFKSI